MTRQLHKVGREKSKATFRWEKQLMKSESETYCEKKTRTITATFIARIIGQSRIRLDWRATTIDSAEQLLASSALQDTPTQQAKQPRGSFKNTHRSK